MRQIIFVCLCVSSFLQISFCQDSLNYKSKWQVRANAGFNIPITNLLGNGITDNLFEYSDHSSYWKIATSFFFRQHWGVEISYEGIIPKGISKRANKFIDGVKMEYNDNYYPIPSTGASYSSGGSGSIGRGLVGVIYRFEQNRFFIYPKFSAGIFSFYTDWGNAVLKQKNSNNVFKITYDTERRPHDRFVTAISTAAGYRLSKRFSLNLDFMTSYYRTNIKFAKSFIDLNTNASTTEQIKYDRNVFTFSIGAGLIFVMKYRR